MYVHSLELLLNAIVVYALRRKIARKASILLYLQYLAAKTISYGLIGIIYVDWRHLVVVLSTIEFTTQNLLKQLWNVKEILKHFVNTSAISWKEIISIMLLQKNFSIFPIAGVV